MQIQEPTIADLTNMNHNHSASGATGGTIANITGNAATVTGASITAGKTLTVSASETITGTDGKTLTLTGNLTASADATVSGTNTGDQTDLPIVASPSAGTVSGVKITLTSTETQIVGDACNIDSNGKAHLAKADAIANAGTIVMAAHTVTNSASNTYLTHGVMRLASSPSWTVGGIVYLSTTGTSGNTLTQTAPSGANNVIQPLGVAIAADTMIFNPTLAQVEHV